MEERSTVSDKIDGLLFSLPFEDRIKCWELIEELIQERTEESRVRRPRVTEIESGEKIVCGTCVHYRDCEGIVPYDAPPCGLYRKQLDK